MVDPNRKINRLTDKDVEFLEECEREFASRYTKEDAEFMEHCSKPLDDPPIIENWISSDFSWGDGSGQHYKRTVGRNQRNWRNNSRNRGGGRDNFDNRHSTFKINRHSIPAFKQEQKRSNLPINVRKQYNNFVAASKDF